MAFPKGNEFSSNHPFSGVNSLFVAGRVLFIWLGLMEQADLPNEGAVFFSDPSGLDTRTKRLESAFGFFRRWLWWVLGSSTSFWVMVFHGSTQQTLTKRVDGSCRVYLCFKPKNAFWTNNIGTGTTLHDPLAFFFWEWKNVGAVNLPHTLKGAFLQRVPSGFIPELDPLTTGFTHLQLG